MNFRSLIICIGGCSAIAASSLLSPPRAPAESLGAASTTNAAQIADTVRVTHFMPVFRVGGVGLYRLTFEYEFPTGTRVFLPGLGEVPSEGSFSYLTQDRTLTFLDEQGTVLKRVALQRTGIPTEGAGSMMPAPEEFPPEYKSFLRRGPLASDHCDAILNRYFASGYRPRVERGVTFYVTAYEKITTPVANKDAEVALQVSTPYPADTRGQVAFRVQVLVREKGELSATWAKNVSVGTREAANRFRDRVAASLQQP